MIFVVSRAPPEGVSQGPFGLIFLASILCYNDINLVLNRPCTTFQATIGDREFDGMAWGKSNPVSDPELVPRYPGWGVRWWELCGEISLLSPLACPCPCLPPEPGGLLT